MPWIDCQKAYDIVSHSWIKKILKITHVAVNIQNLVTNGKENWRTSLSSNGKELGKVKIKIEIFHSEIYLKQEDAGFRYSGDRENINHFLSMYDLKLYRRNQSEVERLRDILKNYSYGMGMQFGLEKCVVLVVDKVLRRRAWGQGYLTEKIIEI